MGEIVMLRYGKWVYDETIGGMKHYYCSNCKKITPGNECYVDENQILWFKFCPKCGVKMNGEYEQCYGYVIKSNTGLYYCGDTNSFDSAITNARVYPNELYVALAIKELKDSAFADRYTLKSALVEIHEVNTESTDNEVSQNE
jgi:NAD-dependent SIR2 family protein deacetylase